MAIKPRRYKTISYMPQRFGLYEDLASVMENLNLYADLHGVPMDERRERFDQNPVHDERQWPRSPIARQEIYRAA